MTDAEKVLMDVEGKFWTRQNEMVEELEELDYEVTAICWESGKGKAPGCRVLWRLCGR